MRIALPLMLSLAACSPSAYVVGDIDGNEFTSKTRAYHGESHIMIVDDADCIDLPWVDDRYFDGTNPWPGQEFVGVQISQRTGAALETGVFGLGNDSPVKAYGMAGRGDAFNVHVGREGSVEITDISPKGVKGNFSISLTDSGVAGEFDAEWCLNIQ
ncbi:MAG: hypothetical protein KC912_17465 [Proteobacteria bacterium]|nr:hypothetical protein [Pseudomonadota bacterium]